MQHVASNLNITFSSNKNHNHKTPFHHTKNHDSETSTETYNTSTKKSSEIHEFHRELPNNKPIKIIEPSKTQLEFNRHTKSTTTKLESKISFESKMGRESSADKMHSCRRRRRNWNDIRRGSLPRRGDHTRCRVPRGRSPGRGPRSRTLDSWFASDRFRLFGCWCCAVAEEWSVDGSSSSRGLVSSGSCCFMGCVMGLRMGVVKFAKLIRNLWNVI